jgi:release factor glutamine methyltransferase
MSDISSDALAVALENAVAHGVADRVEAGIGDLFEVTPSPSLPVDLVTANLPYIPTDVIPTLAVAASFEPVRALDGGADGLDLVRRLLERLPGVLAPGGMALVEIGVDQGATAPAEAAARLPDWVVRVHPDLGGRPRVLALTPPSATAIG